MKQDLTDEYFREALFKEDDLGSVVRVHLYVEYLIDEIIDILVPYPDDLKSIKLDYDGKVNLICALGVDPKNKSVFSSLGKMRNKFSHNPFYKLTKSEVNNLYKVLAEEAKSVLQESHNKSCSNHETDSYKNLAPKDQFILIAIVIKNIALAIKRELNENV